MQIMRLAQVLQVPAPQEKGRSTPCSSARGPGFPSEPQPGVATGPAAAGVMGSVVASPASLKEGTRSLRAQHQSLISRTASLISRTSTLSLRPYMARRLMSLLASSSVRVQAKP